MKKLYVNNEYVCVLTCDSWKVEDGHLLLLFHGYAVAAFPSYSHYTVTDTEVHVW